MTVPAQTCKGNGRAPATDPYQCDRCDLAETGVCGLPEPRELPPVLIGDLAAPELAEFFWKAGAEVEADQATTYTHDGLYEAATFFVEALLRQLAGAEVIRRERPAEPAPTLHRL